MRVEVYAVRAGREPDELVVEGAVEGTATVARGWLSAIEQHFPPSAYEQVGDELVRDDDAQARRMTAAEQRAYCERLLLEVYERKQTPVLESLSLAVRLDPRPAE